MAATSEAFIEQAEGVLGWRWSRDGVEAFFTSRRGGVSAPPYDELNLGLHVGDTPTAVAHNRSLVRDVLGVDDARSAVQVHGTDIAVEPRDRWGARPPEQEADALLTVARGRALAVMVADCIPLVLASDEAVAVVHAGWRGLVGGIVERTIAAMPGAVRTAASGPSLGPCCFEVGEEVAARFNPPHVERVADRERPHVDAWAELDARLRAAGVDRHDALGLCTVCDARCFSHRRDGGTTGRQAVLAWRL